MATNISTDKGVDVEDSTNKVDVVMKTPGIVFTMPEFDSDHMSTKGRMVADVSPPLTFTPKESELFINIEKNIPNVDFLKKFLLQEGRLDLDHAIRIIRTASSIMREEHNVVHTTQPVAIFGDILGQYYDLVKTLDIAGDINDTNMVFLGNYVNRGYFSIETILLLYSLKINYPKKVHLLRGNHECKIMTERFTFKLECCKKYNISLYEEVVSSFYNMPLAAIVDNSVLCVHAGIGPEIKKINDIEKVHRYKEIPMFGRLNDLVWSDPSPTYNSKMLVGNERHISERDFEPNTMRACSYYYSHYAAFNFLKKNKLKFMVRGHQILKTGYKLHRKTKEGHHSIISLFSAPNFLDVFGNEGAFLFYKDNEVNLKTFTAVSTKTYWLPGFMDGFTWSLPYIGEKVTEFLSAILNVCSPEEVEKGMISLSVDGNDLESTTDFDKSGKGDGTHATSSEEESDSQASEGDAEDPSERPSSRKAVNKVRRENMRKKIFALGKFTKMFVSIREDRENMGELRELIENTRARSFNLTTGVATLNHSATSFEDALRWNRKNEMMPAKRDGQSYLENLNGPHEPEEDYEERDSFTESSKSDGGSGSDTASTLG